MCWRVQKHFAGLIAIRLVLLQTEARSRSGQKQLLEDTLGY